ncbi:MAG: hypothetical protein IKP12_02995 [Acholeplasmatales bacterium]|nr:hypothetical protein [Acholeplasmatales bacterium]
MMKSRKYPATSIEDCIDFLKKVEKFNGPVGYQQMADVYGVSTSTNSFKARVSSSKQFGFVDADGQKIELTKAAKNLLYPISEDSREIILIDAVNKPSLYKELIEKYNGKQVPNLNALSNVLFNDYSIIKTSKDAAAKAFIDSLNYVGVIKNGILIYNAPISNDEESSKDDAEVEENEEINVSGIEKKEQVFTPIISKDEINDSFIEQKYETESGRYAKIIIPRDATKDDLVALKEMFEILLKRKFKLNEEDFN